MQKISKTLAIYTPQQLHKSTFKKHFFGKFEVIKTWQLELLELLLSALHLLHFEDIKAHSLAQRSTLPGHHQVS